MVINVKKLEQAGVAVRMLERTGNGEHRKVLEGRDVIVEVYPAKGITPEELIEAVKKTVKTPEYQDAMIGNIISKVQMFQILEAIEVTGKDAD